MALIKCSECGHEVSDKASVCPNCGCPLQYEDNPNVKETNVEPQADKKGNSKKWALIAALFCLIAGGGYFVYSQQTDSGTSNDENRNVVVELTPEFVKAVGQYDQLGIFNEGFAAVCKKEKWGYINHKGEEVIPTSIKAKCVGRFSEGYAFVLQDWDAFSVIDTKGQTVFTSNLNVGLEPTRYESSDMPYYIGGLLYVPCFDENVGVKFVVYDKNGKEIKSVSDKEGRNVYRQNEVGDYTTFSQEVVGANGFPNIQRGVKDAVGNIVIEPKYDFILTHSVYDTDWLDNEYRHKVYNGVVLVVLLEENDEDELSNEGVVRHYAYADLKGNDTFSDDIREKIAQADPLAYHNGDEDDEDLDADGETSNSPPALHEDLSWLNGNWRYQMESMGQILETRVGISGEIITVFMNGDLFYTGNYTIEDDHLVFNRHNGMSDYFVIDRVNHCLKADENSRMQRF